MATRSPIVDSILARRRAPQPRPGPISRATDWLGGAWDLASTALHAPKHVVDVAANYYANEALRQRVLRGEEPIPTGEMFKEALIPPEEAEKSYLRSMARPVAGLGADLMTDPLIGGLKILKPIAAAGQVARGIQRAAEGGKAVAGVVPDAAMTARLARTAAAGRRAELATRGIEASFVPGMARGAYEAGKETIRKLGAEGITPGAAEMGVEAATSGLFAAGMAKGALGRGARAREGRIAEHIREEARKAEEGPIWVTPWDVERARRGRVGRRPERPRPQRDLGLAALQGRQVRGRRQAALDAQLEALDAQIALGAAPRARGIAEAALREDAEARAAAGRRQAAETSRAASLAEPEAPAPVVDPLESALVGALAAEPGPPRLGRRPPPAAPPEPPRAPEVLPEPVEPPRPPMAPPAAVPLPEPPRPEPARAPVPVEAAAPPVPTFREFVEAKGVEWPIYGADPRFKDLQSEYRALKAGRPAEPAEPEPAPAVEALPAEAPAPPPERPAPVEPEVRREPEPVPEPPAPVEPAPRKAPRPPIVPKGALGRRVLEAIERDEITQDDAGVWHMGEATGKTAVIAFNKYTKLMKGVPKRARAPREVLPEPPRDVEGNRILEGQEDWSPQEREIVHGAADAYVRQMVQDEMAEPTGRHVVKEPTPGGPLGFVTRFGVKSPKSGTPLEDLPQSPREMQRALDRDKGNVLEKDIHEAIRNDPQVEEAIEAAEAGRPTGLVERTAAGEQRLIPGALGVQERPIRTEGREAEGPLFTQAEDARIRAEERAQMPMYATAPLPAVTPSPSPFYSHLRKVVDKIKQPRAMAGDILRYLKDQKRGVKAEELKWTGLEQFLRERKGKVTKEELQRFLDENDVEMEELVRGQVKLVDPEDFNPDGSRVVWGEGRTEAEARRDAESWVERNAEPESQQAILGRLETQDPSEATKFGTFQVPGAEPGSYREVLFRLKRGKPVRAEVGPNGWEVFDKSGERVGVYAAASETEALAKARKIGPTDVDQYIEPHFEEPGVVAHVRFNERRGPKGERILFVEEAQSQWHQEAHKVRADEVKRLMKEKGISKEQALKRVPAEFGYRAETLPEPPEQPNYNTWATRRGMSQAEIEATRGTDDPRYLEWEVANRRAARTAFAQARRQAEALPRAPFGGATGSPWHEMVMRRMVRWAAEEGFDEIAWIDGAETAKRYDLSKQVRKVTLSLPEPGAKEGFLVVRPVEGRPIETPTFEVSKLPDYIGKEPAERMMAEPVSRRGGGEHYELEGKGLKIGGEWAKNLYDVMIPSFMKRFGKQWGVKVGETAIKTGRQTQLRVDQAARNAFDVLDADNNPVMPGFQTRAQAEAWIAKEYPDQVPGVRMRDFQSLPITPEMRRSVVEKGVPRFAAAPGRPRAARAAEARARRAIGVREAKAALPGAKMKSHAKGVIATMPNGKSLLIQSDATIVVDPTQFEATYQRGFRPKKEFMAGVFEETPSTRVPWDGVMQLSGQAPPGIAAHEAFHAAMGLALDAKQRASILERYGTEEKAADAYSKWIKSPTKHGIFQQIRRFFQRLYRAFRPTVESRAERVFEEVRTGEAWRRPGAGEGVRGRAFAAGRGPSFEQWLTEKLGREPGIVDLAKEEHFAEYRGLWTKGGRWRGAAEAERKARELEAAVEAMKAEQAEEGRRARAKPAPKPPAEMPPEPTAPEREAFLKELARGDVEHFVEVEVEPGEWIPARVRDVDEYRGEGEVWVFHGRPERFDRSGSETFPISKVRRPAPTAPPRITKAPARGRPKEPKGRPEDILAALRAEDPDPRGRGTNLVQLDRLRARLSDQFPDKASLDDALMSLAREEVIQLQAHGHPAALSSKERAAAIESPRKGGEPSVLFFAAIRPDVEMPKVRRPAPAEARPEEQPPETEPEAYRDWLEGEAQLEKAKMHGGKIRRGKYKGRIVERAASMREGTEAGQRANAYEGESDRIARRGVFPDAQEVEFAREQLVTQYRSGTGYQGMFERIKAGDYTNLPEWHWRRIIREAGITSEADATRIREGGELAPIPEGRLGIARAPKKAYAVAPLPVEEAPMARPEPPPRASYRAAEEKLPDRLIRHFQDKFVRLKRTVETVRKRGGRVTEETDPYLAVERFDSVTAEKLRDAERTLADPLVKALAKPLDIPQWRETETGRVSMASRQARASLEELGDYMSLRHAPTRDRIISERTEGGMEHGSGWSPEEARAGWSALEEKFGSRDKNGRIEALESLAEFVRDAREESLRVMVEGGLISKDQAQGWRERFGEDYVPMRTAEVETGLGTGQGFDIRGRESKSATGRTTKADNPVVFMMSQLQRSIVRAEKNKVDQTFAKFVEDNPDPMLWERDVEHMRREVGPDGKVREVRDMLADQEDLSYKVDGEKHRLTVRDPLLLRAMKNLSAQETGALLRKLGGFTRFYSQMVTSWNPEFIVSNFARDIQAAMATVTVEQSGKIARQIPKNVFPAMKGMLGVLRGKGAGGKWETLAKEFREDGGAIGFYFLKDVPALEKQMESRIRTAGPGALRAGQRALLGIRDVVEDMNKAVENGTRLAVYSALRDSGASRIKAASVAKNVTLNFNRKGEAGAGINSLYVFFNASMQGTKRLTEVIRTKRGQKLAAGIIAGGWALDQYNRAAAGDSDRDGTNDWDAIPPWVKERNLILMRGKGETPIMFPMPYGFNVLHNLGQVVGATTGGEMTPARAAASMGSSLWNSFNPLGSEADIAQVLSPTALDPIIQHEMNRDFTGRAIRPTRYPGQARPDSELYFRNVPPLARGLAEVMNKTTGGDKVTPGLISVSPETLDHFFKFFAGGLGRFGSNVVNSLTSIAEGKPPELRSVPFARRLLYEEHPGATGMRFRENIEELDTLWARYKHYRETRNRAAIARLPRAMLRIKRRIDSIESRIRAIRRGGIAIRGAEGRIEALQRQANNVIAAARRRAS